MITGNKGEWSELYVLLKILSERTLFAGSSSMQKSDTTFYPIVEVIRTESHGEFKFSYIENNISVHCNGVHIKSFPMSEFVTNSSLLLEKILSSRGTTFQVPEIENFMNSYCSNTIKAKSTSKSDIVVRIHDLRTNQQPILGFSIKSQLGGNSTLLNASQATNFQFKIEGGNLSDNDMVRINKISSHSKIRKRIEEIEKLGNSLIFQKINKSVFKNNLILIDSLLPEIIANSLLYYNKGEAKFLKEIVALLKTKNPLKYDLSSNHNFYSYKIKRLVMDVALGMTPTKIWGGRYDATGGYLVVKGDGEIVCYHVYSKNEFEEYLLSNTRFETSSSTRNKFGSIYKTDSGYFFNLNLQIRFI